MKFCLKKSCPNSKKKILYASREVRSRGPDLQKMCFCNVNVIQNKQMYQRTEVRTVFFKMLYLEALLEPEKLPHHQEEKKFSNFSNYDGFRTIWKLCKLFWSMFCETTLIFTVRKAHLLPNRDLCYCLPSRHRAFYFRSSGFILFLNESS